MTFPMCFLWIECALFGDDRAFMWRPLQIRDALVEPDVQVLDYCHTPVVAEP
jgi:hypothetical protein